MCCHVFEPSVSLSVPDLTGSTDTLDACMAVFDEPLSYAEARRGPEWEKWKESIEEELEGLSKQRTWSVVDIPEGANLMKTKWVFKKKKTKEGTIERYRACLVCKGYSQVHGVDYDQTFSPVVRHSTMRIVLGLCAQYGLHTRHFDTPKAFPQADIDYDCYIRAPVGTRLPPG